jgi:hypothetical protein
LLVHATPSAGVTTATLTCSLAASAAAAPASRWKLAAAVCRSLEYALLALILQELRAPADGDGGRGF